MGKQVSVVPLVTELFIISMRGTSGLNLHTDAEWSGGIFICLESYIFQANTPCIVHQNWSTTQQSQHNPLHAIGMGEKWIALVANEKRYKFLNLKSAEWAIG